MIGSSFQGSPSTPSPEDHRSLFSLSTATSTSTFSGPGSLAGKAIQNVGKLTLKGVEQILISRRLLSISTHFPHQDATHIAGLPEMYSDLLELSRIHMYSESTRIRALQLIIGQIASRYTSHLIRALLAWPEIEVSLLLSEVLSCLDPIRTSRPIENEDPLISAYLQRLSKWEDHSLAPVVEFLRAFASSGEDTWSTVISCGSLELLLHLYLSDFGTPIAFNMKTEAFQKSVISATCSSFLLDALADERARQMIQSHALRRLWPLRPMLAFEAINESRCTLRSQTWRTLGRKYVQWRISSIFDTLVMDWVKAQMTHLRLYVDHALFDTLVDLVEFSGSSILDEDTCFRALRSLHYLTCCFNSVEIGARISMYIEQTDRDHAREIFIHIIRRLTLLSRRAPESDAFFTFCHQNCQPQSCPLDPDASIHFIHRFLRISESNETFRLWLIEGDIHKLLDSTETRSLSCGTWTGYENIRDSVNPQYVTGGPAYRALVLSLAWRMFSSPDDDKRVQNSANEADLYFPIMDHHDDWASNQMDESAFQLMRQTHKERVYSWIET